MAKHLFVMDPMETLNRPLDTTLRMAGALDRRGEDCYLVTPKALSWDRDDGCAKARCHRLRLKGGAAEASLELGFFDMTLDSFASIHMRKDPPYDMQYIMTTWLLESAQRSARIYNHPAALRGLNEKLSIFHFPEATAEGLVSSSADELLAFAETKADGDAIVKPLDLFGGRDVHRIQPALDRSAALTTLQTATRDGKELRLIQPFDKAIFEGEVRVFTAFGQPMAWCLKKPTGGGFLANTGAGATIEAYEPTPEEVERVTTVAESLMMDGVVFIGFDVIGGMISEINITSPRLLLAAGEAETVYDDIARMIIDDIARG